MPPPPPPPSPPAYRQSPLTAYFCKNVSQICLQKSGLICHKKIHLRHPGSCIFYKKSKEGWSKSSLSCVHDPPITSGRPRHTALQTFRHSSSRCSQMFAPIGNSTELFSGTKDMFLARKIRQVVAQAGGGGGGGVGVRIRAAAAIRHQCWCCCRRRRRRTRPSPPIALLHTSIATTW